jgi:hypothetical protein
MFSQQIIMKESIIVDKNKIVSADVSKDLKAVFTKYGFTNTAVAFIAEAMEISIDEANDRWDAWMEDDVYTSLFNPILAGDGYDV